MLKAGDDRDSQLAMSPASAVEATPTTSMESSSAESPSAAMEPTAAESATMKSSAPTMKSSSAAMESTTAESTAIASAAVAPRTAGASGKPARTTVVTPVTACAAVCSSRDVAIAESLLAAVRSASARQIVGACG